MYRSVGTVRAPYLATGSSHGYGLQDRGAFAGAAPGLPLPAAPRAARGSGVKGMLLGTGVVAIQNRRMNCIPHAISLVWLGLHPCWRGPSVKPHRAGDSARSHSPAGVPCRTATAWPVVAPAVAVPRRDDQVVAPASASDICGPHPPCTGLESPEPRSRRLSWPRMLGRRTPLGQPARRRGTAARARHRQRLSDQPPRRRGEWACSNGSTFPLLLWRAA